MVSLTATNTGEFSPKLSFTLKLIEKYTDWFNFNNKELKINIFALKYYIIESLNKTNRNTVLNENLK